MNWRIVPSRNPEDQLYNRRLLAYYLVFFALIWVHEVLFVWAWLTSENHEIPSAAIVAFLGVPASIAGLGFWEYLKAAKRNEESQDV